MASSKEYQCDIIGTTHLYIKFNIFRAKKLLSLIEHTCDAYSVRDNFFIQFYILHFTHGITSLQGFYKTSGTSSKSSFADLKVSCAQAFSFGASVARGVLI